MSKHGSNYRGRRKEICNALPTAPGIYILWFDGLPRAYIGQSNNIAFRVGVHLYEIDAFRGHKMRGDLDTYGWARLRASVLETAETCNTLHEAETYWLNKYRAGGWELYNHDVSGKLHRDRARVR